MPAYKKLLHPTNTQIRYYGRLKKLDEDLASLNGGKSFDEIIKLIKFHIDRPTAWSRHDLKRSMNRQYIYYQEMLNRDLLNVHEVRFLMDPSPSSESNAGTRFPVTEALTDSKELIGERFLGALDMTTVRRVKKYYRTKDVEAIMLRREMLAMKDHLIFAYERARTKRSRNIVKRNHEIWKKRGKYQMKSVQIELYGRKIFMGKYKRLPAGFKKMIEIIFKNKQLFCPGALDIYIPPEHLYRLGIKITKKIITNLLVFDVIDYLLHEEYGENPPPYIIRT